MLPAILSLLALVGGCAVTYFIMGAPRRKAIEKLKRIAAARERLDEDIREHRQEAKRQRDYEKDLNARDDTLIREEKNLERTRAEFERRIIAYSTLENENRLLRTDLKNAATHSAYLEHANDSSRMSESVVEVQRNTLGKDYFDEVVKNAKRSLNLANYLAQKKRVESVAAYLRGIGFDVPPVEEHRVLVDLHALYLKAIRADSEKKEQTRIKEIMRDEERRLREDQEAIERGEREQALIQVAIEEALYKAMNDVEGKHAAELDALRTQLAEVKANTERVKSNAELGIKHGHVYVISNIGSFGDDVYKIGMTRRTVPEDRVKELGDASVPFPFDVHMMIKCNDAPKLESALHRAFNNNRLNKVNPRKEFFRAKFEAILDLVKKEHGEVEFVALPTAEQYRYGLTMTPADIAEVDQAFEEADSNVEALDEED